MIVCMYRYTHASVCIHLCLCLYVCMLLCYLLSDAWLWDPTDCSPPGASVLGILQARILEWVAISSSRGIFPTQGSNSRLLHRQLDSLPLSHLGRDILGDTESGHKPSNYFSWISGGWEGESSSSKHNKNNSEKITSVLLKSFIRGATFNSLPLCTLGFLSVYNSFTEISFMRCYIYPFQVCDSVAFPIHAQSCTMTL